MSGLPKRFVLLLSASVALNLFFVGLFTARHLMPQRMHMHQDFGVQSFLRRSGLREASPQVRDALESERPNARARIHAIGEARAQVRDALQAVPFDAARLDTAFDAVRARTAAMQQDAFATLSRVARELDDAQRKRMADALWARGGGNHEHRAR